MLTKLREYFPDSKEEKFKINYTFDENKVIIDFDFFLYKYDLYWKKAKVTFINESETYRKSPVNWKNTLFEKNFTITWLSNRVVLDLDNQNFYSYNWKHINSKLKILIQIDDSFFIDTKITKEIEKYLDNKNKNIISSNSILKQTDYFSYFKNFLALWLFHKLYVLTILSICIFSFFIFIFLSPFVLFFAWLLIKKIFQNYMTFELKKWFSFNYLNNEYNLSEIVTWKSKIDLHNITIRVVFSNTEVWQSIVWTWEHRRTRTFIEQVNGFILYNEQIKFIPKNTDISDYLKWSISLDEIYKKLYPPLFITENHWIGITREIQLIHNRLVDKEIKWPECNFRYEDFLV